MLAESIAVGRARTSAARATAASWQYLGALNRGWPMAAQRAAAGVTPEWRPLSRQAYLVLGMIYGGGDSTTGNVAARALQSEVTRPLASDAAELRSQKIHVCVAVQWAIMTGQAPLLGPAPAKLRATEPDASSALRSYFESCALIAEAGRAVLERRPNRRRLMERLDSIQLNGTAWHWLLIAFLAGDLREEGALALVAADTSGTLAAWRHYLALRAEPEDALKADVESVRLQVAQLEAARRVGSRRP